LVPESLISYSGHDDRVVPRFLGEHDHVWMRALLDEFARFVGRPQRELDERLREPLPCESPSGKRALAIQVLRRLSGQQRRAAVPPPSARAALFGEAARASAARETVLANVAARLGTTVVSLEDSLFADLPSERLVVPIEASVSPTQLALRANLALAQAFISRAAAVAVEVEGNARALVRHAKLRGLLCTVTPRSDPGSARLEISGPLALFRHTLVYGRALGELLPLLARCLRFRLRAVCVLPGRRVTLELGSADPIFPALETRLYDSLVEERFARDFRRAAPDWDVIREPEPIAAGGTLVFPDFALQHRQHPGRRWLLEIVGFWTPGYLTRKLAQYRAAGLPNLILCIDEQRNCADGDLPDKALVVRYKRRVDAAAVHRLLLDRASS